MHEPEKINDDNDQEFYRLAFENYYNKIYKTVYLMTRDPELTLDIVQESFLKMFTNINQLREPAKLKAWLYTIAINKAKEALRKKNRNNKLVSIIDNIAKIVSFSKPLWNQNLYLPEDNIMRKELEEYLVKAINEINENYKEVIILRYYLDLSEKEIAKLLDINPGIVKSRLNRAKTKIKNKLTNYLHE